MKIQSRILTFLTLIIVIVALTLSLTFLIMHPPMGDMLSLAGMLAITGIVAILVAYISNRMGWWRQFRSFTRALTLSYLLATGLTLLNVWYTAKLMFINDHDFALASILLLFAGAISVAFAYFISSSVTEGMRDLVTGAEQLAEGDFTTRVPVEGLDEVAQLGRTFNEMVVRLEEAVNAERALEDARRNLVAWASHDLRTPLAAMRAMIDALSDGVITDEKTVNRYLHQCQKEIMHMNTLITDLFELAQLDAGRLELLGEASSLSDLISDTLEGFTARAREADINLTGDVRQGIDPVWMAPDKISRVLHNLIENAIRHTPASGDVHIQAVPVPGKQLVQITVTDTGTGIPEDDLHHIFERFYRGEKSRARDGYQSGGAGLGLAIAKGIVEAHQGTIWIESTVGGGSAFHFTLPRGNHA